MCLGRRLKRRIRASWGRFYRFGLLSGAMKGPLTERGPWRRRWDDGTVLGAPWGWVGARSPPEDGGLSGCRSRNWPWSEGISIEQLKSRNIKKLTALYFFPFLFISWRLITLQYCSGFAIHWHESAMDLHVFPILNPPSHLPPHPIPLGHPNVIIFVSLNISHFLFLKYVMKTFKILYIWY